MKTIVDGLDAVKCDPDMPDTCRQLMISRLQAEPADGGRLMLETDYISSAVEAYKKLPL